MLAIIAWGVAGVQVWLLAVGFGMSPSVSGLLLAVGAYALAWVVGFLAVFMPAGTGVREGILSLFFTGVLSSGGVLAVVLVSRIAMTVAARTSQQQSTSVNMNRGTLRQLFIQPFDIWNRKTHTAM